MEDTSFTENTDNADYDNIRMQINSESTDQTRVDLNDFDFTDVTRRLAKNQQDKKARKEGTIQILRMIRNENLGDYGVSSRELLDGISEAKFSNKGKPMISLDSKDLKNGLRKILQVCQLLLSLSQGLSRQLL